MTSIIKLAMIVLMARLDLRFFSIRFFAHFTRLILSSFLQWFPSLPRLASQVRRGQNEPKFLDVYLVGKPEPLIEISSSLFTELYAIKLFASIALFSTP